MATIQSSCICGQNRISFTNKPIVKFRCHCTDERKLTGAAFALNILFSTDSLKILSGTLKTWSKLADSGNTITNHVCDGCGGLLYRTSDGYPGTMVIKAGCIDSFDASEEYVPDVEIFTRSRVSWVEPIKGAKQEVADFTE
ncbi:Mss4-like protein [Fusarium solani]|uniref:Mss4-like protein n=1 Tax=Fusarium solani TaxID=169388 RepID=A0A9P9JLX0_FUSSL|nr:Mss4-like protein [Fusarium solani]KAH7227246.1 Mss4-like protein [Fusarium solani]